MKVVMHNNNSNLGGDLLSLALVGSSNLQIILYQSLVATCYNTTTYVNTHPTNRFINSFSRLLQAVSVIVC
jgi:hypothetical protein